MPFEQFELIKLIIGIIIITIPGYLWSFVIFKQITRLERFIFGLILGFGVLTCTLFMFNVILNVKITQHLTISLFVVYTCSSILSYCLHLNKYGFPKIDLKNLKNRKFIILTAIIGFTFLMIFLPHLSNNYLLPFHVDEWVHWSYSQMVMESGSTTFLNPYTGFQNVGSGEIGFHITTACLSWLSGANLLSIFLFMPSIIGVLISITVFNIGERFERKFGLEAAFFIGFIPTTIRFLGPSFYVAVTFGLLLLVFIIWITQLKKWQGAVLTLLFVWYVFIVHPQTALAVIIFISIYSIILVIEKQYKIALLLSVFSAIPIIIAYYFTTKWDYYIDMLLGALYGEEYLLDLPEILINFNHLGIITWILFIIGIYYSFLNGRALKRSLCITSIAFIVIIGLYDTISYGSPLFYNRIFLYLFLFVAMIAGLGLSEITIPIKNIIEKNLFKNKKQITKHSNIIFPAIVCVILFTTAVFSHISIPYYQMIDEKEYETFIWIRDNIEGYRDEYHLYDRAAVDPFKAPPFSAITRLYIVTTSMHPLISYDMHTEMERFLNQNCTNIDFLEQNQISIIYGPCNNPNLTEIYENVYLYKGTPPTVNFTYYPINPTINDTILFNSTSITPYGVIIKYSWNFGDENITEGYTTELEFDGTNDYVEIDDDPSLDINNEITVEFWVKPKLQNQQMVALGKQSTYQFWCSDNKWYFGVYNESGFHGSGYSLSKSPVQEWTHILGLYNQNLASKQVQIWINGEKENVGDYTGEIRNTDHPFRIGGRLLAWDDVYFNGSIKDVRIYNRALNGVEINESYNGNITTSGLVSWWKIDEIGKTIYDSIQDNDGLIHEARWTNYAEHKYSKSGTYKVQLTVLNEDGQYQTLSKNITVL